jgi:putative colanic acid biosynthesis acetyltransferase WcaF
MESPPLPSETALAAEPKVYTQANPYTSPWSAGQRLRMLLWEISWALFCRWTPKPLNTWRLFWLRLFAAEIEGYPFVHQRARITLPWNLTLRDRACLGDGAHAYTLARIELGRGATVAQEAYLCTGTHDFAQAALPLVTAPIVIGADAFIGARAFVLPGVTIGERAVIGACAVVTRDVAASTIVAGNPARQIGRRPPAT